MFGSYICGIIAGSADSLLRYCILLNSCKSTVGNTQPWCVPWTYSIIWSGKHTLKLFPFLCRSKSKKLMTSSFAQLNWNSKSTMTLDIITLGSSSFAWHILDGFILFNVVYYKYVALSSRFSPLDDPSHP